MDRRSPSRSTRGTACPSCATFPHRTARGDGIRTPLTALLSALALGLLAGCGASERDAGETAAEAPAGETAPFASRPDEIGTGPPAPVETAAEEAPTSGTRSGRRPPRRPTPPATTAELVVVEIVSGDTLRLRDGRVVRLAQIDAPDPLRGDCYGLRARRLLQTMTPRGTRIRLESDPAIVPVDAAGRLVRYVRVDGDNVNLRLVRAGAASVWFPDGERGRHAGTLLAAAQAARDARVGLWADCRGTKLTPKRPLATVRPRRR